MKMPSARLCSLLFVFFLAPCFSVHGQSANEVQERILRDFARIISLRDKPSDKATDTVEMVNRKLLKYLVKACISNPSLLKADFKRVTDEGQMNILTSEDGVVRIYNWDTQRGGATIYYNAIAQFRIDDSTTGVAVLNDISRDANGAAGNSGEWYSKICTVERKHNSTAYLLVSKAMYTPHSKESFVDAYTLSYRRFVPTHIFVNKSKYLTTLSVAYQGTEANPEIRVSADKKNVFVPIVNNVNQTVTGKYQLYVFDGSNYVLEKNIKAHDD
jgi:hypothetical protein